MSSTPPNPFAPSPSPSSPPTPRANSPASNRSQGTPTGAHDTPEFPRKPSSMISAASGSPPPTHRASFPDPAKEPKKGSSKLAGPPAKAGFCCDRDREISQGDEISITDAFKTTEGGKVAYITYVIQLGVSQAEPIPLLLHRHQQARELTPYKSHTTRRRYSSFLSLHQALSGLYPVLIIPPIPSKQSIADYAVKGQSKAKEDAAVIARRKRLLEDFLKRLIRHPILGGEHVLHRFLEDGVSWVSEL